MWIPILYIDSGGVKEYCEGFGIKYDVSNLQEAISIFMKDSELYYENMKNYPFSSERMCKDFENLFFDLLEKEKKYIVLDTTKKIRTLIGKGLYLFLRNFKNYSR